jgi:NADH-quinone oxidoreductase subunit J
MRNPRPTSSPFCHERRHDMTVIFYISAAIAVIATLLVITRLRPVHSLLYAIVSLLAVAVIFYVLGAPFIAALEVIIYAGAIMVLFVFVVMMLNLGSASAEEERHILSPRMWIGPSFLAAILLVELIYLLLQPRGHLLKGLVIEPKQIGITLLGPYLLGVELASMLLLAGIVGAYHLGRHYPEDDACRVDYR